MTSMMTPTVWKAAQELGRGFKEKDEAYYEMNEGRFHCAEPGVIIGL